MAQFHKRSLFAVSKSELYAWHTRPGALQRLLPPWEKISVLEKSNGIKEGSRVILKNSIGPIKFTWVALHKNIKPNVEFQDIQEKGPFKKWIHTHRFSSKDDHHSFLDDMIDYQIPFGILGKSILSTHIQNKLKQMFQFRHRRLHDDLIRHKNYKSENSQKIVISGASGLIGSNLSSFFQSGGHTVFHLVRNKNHVDENSIYWNIKDHQIESDELEHKDVVIHLAGKNIASSRWSEKIKEEIVKSRVDGTKMLCEALASLKNPPKCFLCASAIGFYGDRGEETLTEDSPIGEGFLSTTCQQWEQATQPAQDAGIRVVNLRFGMVLSAQGGALQKMLMPFKLGIGGPIANGKQCISWIVLDDLLGAIYHCMNREDISGPVNIVSPSPLSNKEFTKSLAKFLRRPAVIPVPAFAIKLGLGEMGKELLLASTAVLPKKLNDTGFEFYYPTLDKALRHELGLLT